MNSSPATALDRLDPILRSRLPALEAAGHAPGGLTPEAIQQAIGDFIAPVDETPPPDVDVDECTAPGPHGDVPVRVYRPRTDDPTRGLVWMHGGGFVFGDLDMPEADWVSRMVCGRADAVVVSVDYRLCNDDVHYPIPHDDVHAAWVWATGPDGPLGGGGVWSIGGGSAGASLALGVAQQLRDERAAGSPLTPPDCLLLAYPKVHRVTPDGDDDWRDVIAILPTLMAFDHEATSVHERAYLGDESQPLTYATPGDGDLANLPPALVIVSEFDTLRPSGEALVDGLRAAGTPTTFLTAKGATHGHLSIVNHPAALAGIDDMVAFMTDPEARPTA